MALQDRPWLWRGQRTVGCSNDRCQRHGMVKHFACIELVQLSESRATYSCMTAQATVGVQPEHDEQRGKSYDMPVGCVWWRERPVGGDNCRRWDVAVDQRARRAFAACVKFKLLPRSDKHAFVHCRRTMSFRGHHEGMLVAGAVAAAAAAAGGGGGGGGVSTCCT